MFDEIGRTRALLQGFDSHYWIAGGWAVDHFLGQKTRDHKDIEIAIARDDQQCLWKLNGVERIEFMESRVPKIWDGKPLHLPIHELYCHFRTGEVLEVLLNEFDGKNWCYRRNLDIKRPMEIFLSQAGNHMPIEIVLLFKAREIRKIDQHDFARAVKVMSNAQKLWLRNALLCAETSKHPWLEFL